MKLPKIPQLDLVYWVLIAVAVAMVGLFAWWLIDAPAREARLRETVRVDRVEQQETQRATNAAQAITTNALNTATQEEQTRHDDETIIRAAPGADQRLNPDLNRAALRQLCNHAPYRGTADCVRLFGRPDATP